MKTRVSRTGDKNPKESKPHSVTKELREFFEFLNENASSAERERYFPTSTSQTDLAIAVAKVWSIYNEYLYVLAFHISQKFGRNIFKLATEIRALSDKSKPGFLNLLEIVKIWTQPPKPSGLGSRSNAERGNSRASILKRLEKDELSLKSNLREMKKIDWIQSRHIQDLETATFLIANIQKELSEKINYEKRKFGQEKREFKKLSRLIGRKPALSLLSVTQSTLQKEGVTLSQNATGWKNRLRKIKA